METPYYRIDHKNSMTTFDDQTLTQLKSLLFCEFASKEESFIGNQIDNIILKILNATGQEDLLDIIYKLSNEFIAITNLNIDNNEYNLKLCEQIAFRNFKMEFIFNSEFIEEVANLISFGLHKMQKVKTEQKLTYTKFISIAKQIMELNIDLIKVYRNYDNDSAKDMITYIIPNEFILLMNIFQGIKTLKMSLEETNTILIKGCLLILLNYEWLFPFVFDVEFDLTCEKLFRDINKEYQKKIFLLNQLRRKNSDSSDEEQLNISTINTQNKNDYTTLIKENADILTIVVVFSYFISHFNLLRNLNIISPHSFIREIYHNITLKGSNLTSFHFIDFLFNLNKIVSLKIEFNSLERESFDKILLLIQNNSSLRHLNINLFCKNEEFYSWPILYKIAEENGMVIESSYAFREINIDDDIALIAKEKTEGESTERERILLNKLINDFEVNFEKMFLLLQSKKNFQSLTINMDLPTLISGNEKYTLIFLKFLFNIILMLNRERLHLTELKIISPFLNFDNRKNPLIQNFLESINLNNKNKFLNSFHFQLQLSNIPNISNLISYHLQFLFIGDLDLETFEFFLKFYHSSDYIERSELLCLEVSMRKTIFDYNSFKDNLTQLVQGKNPKSLKEFYFYSCLSISAIELEELLSATNGNTVEKYVFQIKQSDTREFLKFKYDRFWYSNKNIKIKIHKYIDVIIKLKLYNHKKLCKTFIQFLLKNNQKEIIILK